MEKRIAWWKLVPVAGGAAVAGGVLTLLVVDGTAGVSVAGAAPQEVKAGERFTRPAPGAPAGAVSRAAPADPAVAAVEAAHEDPAAMPREALAREVVRLRDEREALLRERAKLKAALEVERKTPEHGTYHRIPEAELLASAEAGRLRIRLPHLHDAGGQLWDEEATRDVGLTPEEEAAIHAVYERSTRRLTEGLGALYQEIGGDPAVKDTLSAQALFQEIQLKSHRDDARRAVRQGARERAGLAAPGAGGAPIERALRLLWQEDDRVVAELDALLGPERAARFLDHPDTHHSDWTTEVGPER